MKLIDEKKVKKQVYGVYERDQASAFMVGVHFAEQQLEPLFNKFAEWVINNHVGVEYKLPTIKITDNTLLTAFLNEIKQHEHT